MVGPYTNLSATVQSWSWQKWTLSHTSHFDVTHITHLF